MDSESLQPSTSRQSAKCTTALNESLELNIDNEAAEIARLQLPLPDVKEEDVATKPPPAEDERIAKVEFHCANCDMHELVHYYGKEPPFVYALKFLEDTYVMRDPFQPPPPRWKRKAEYFIAIGAKCNQCQRSVCKDAECSIYYAHTFCLQCATKTIKQFPVEVQAKIRKQLTLQKS